MHLPHTRRGWRTSMCRGRSGAPPSQRQSVLAVSESSRRGVSVRRVGGGILGRGWRSCVSYYGVYAMVLVGTS